MPAPAPHLNTAPFSGARAAQDGTGAHPAQQYSTGHVAQYGTHPTRSTIGGGRGCNKFVPVLGGDSTKIAPTGDIFDQPPGGMISIRGKLADHVGDHVVLSLERAVFVTSLGTESSYPRPPQSLNNSPPSYLDITRQRHSIDPFSLPTSVKSSQFCTSLADATAAAHICRVATSTGVSFRFWLEFLFRAIPSSTGTIRTSRRVFEFGFD